MLCPSGGVAGWLQAISRPRTAPRNEVLETLRLITLQARLGVGNATPPKAGLLVFPPHASPTQEGWHSCQETHSSLTSPASSRWPILAQVQGHHPALELWTCFRPTMKTTGRNHQKVHSKSQCGPGGSGTLSSMCSNLVGPSAEGPSSLQRRAQWEDARAVDGNAGTTTRHR